MEEQWRAVRNGVQWCVQENTNPRGSYHIKRAVLSGGECVKGSFRDGGAAHGGKGVIVRHDSDFLKQHNEGEAEKDRCSEDF